MNHFHVTPCTLGDFFSILNARNEVLKTINNSDLYFPSNPLELMQYIIFPNSFVCKINDRRKIVAFSSVAFNHGMYKIEDTAVHPNYRGMGMQRKMWEYIISQIPKGSIIICTIHPQNIHSLDNALSLGFEIIDRKNMYKSERYILEFRKA